MTKQEEINMHEAFIILLRSMKRDCAMKKKYRAFFSALDVAETELEKIQP